MLAMKIDRRVAVAPMMDWTDRHQRRFMRLITPSSLLFTEMVTTGAILRGDTARFLDFDPAEHPVALQLGGADPADLRRSARAGAEWGYHEINLNCGCPSDRVQAARFGACLMAEPDLVANCVKAMQDGAGSVPVTVKSRIGIDDRDDYGFLAHFVETIAAAGVTTLTIHARKAWLSGLSPKQNREVPPLVYDRAYRIKADFPEMEIVVNGGITDLAGIDAHLARVDGVMIGREAYQNPWFMASVETHVFGTDGVPDRHRVAGLMADYAEDRMAEGTPLHSVTRHMLGLFNGLPGARSWRRTLSEGAREPGATPQLIVDAAGRIRQPALADAA